MQELVRYDAMRHAIVEARNVDEVKDIRDKAEALRLYARQSKDFELESWVSEIKLRAIRRIGELSAALEKAPHGPGRGKSHPANGTPLKRAVLASANISTSVAHRCEKVAAMPAAEFERYLASMSDAKKPATVVDAIRFVTKGDGSKKRAAYLARTAVDIECAPILWQCDALKFLAEVDAYDLLLTDPPYMTDVSDIRAFAASWLPHALERMKPTGRAYVCIGAYPQELYAYLSVAMPKQVLVWTYRNTIGPTPTHKYKQNWQAILYYQGVDAPPLNCPVMNEQFSVQDINAPDGRLGDRFHAWQKPDELGDRLVRHGVVDGGLMVDPFAGTGSFLLSAARNGMRAIGCDINATNIEIARERGCNLQ